MELDGQCYISGVRSPAFETLPAAYQAVAIRAFDTDWAWRRADALQVVDALSALRHAVASIIVWVQFPDGARLSSFAVYQCDIEPAKSNEPWEAVVERANEAAAAYVRAFRFSDDDPASVFPPLFAICAYAERDFRTRRFLV